MINWVTNGNISLEGLQKQKSVNAVGATATFARSCGLVCSGVASFVVFHHFCYSRSGKWSFRSEKVPRLCACGSCPAHGSEIVTLKPIVFFYRFYFLRHLPRDIDTSKLLLLFPMFLVCFFRVTTPLVREGQFTPPKVRVARRKRYSHADFLSPRLFRKSAKKDNHKRKPQ